jgi:hypothetical protein
MRFNLYVEDKIFPCEELKVYLYKDLLRSIYGEQPSVQTFLDTIKSILNTLSGISYEYIDSISIIELFSGILQLRMNSMGDRIVVVLKSDDKDKKKKNIEIRLDWINNDLMVFCNTFINKTIQLTDNITAVLESPSIARLLEKTEDEYLYFVKAIIIENNTYKINSNKELSDILETLPIKATLALVGHFEDIVTNISNLNFLERYGVTEQNLNFIPTIDNLLWFTKLIFSESLDTFYDNLFYLSYIGHMELSFINQCTPGDYMYFVKKLEATLARQNPDSGTDQIQFGQGVADEELAGME